MLTYNLNGENVTAKGSTYLTEDKIKENPTTSTESEEDSEEKEPTTEYTTTRKSTTKHTIANSPIKTTSGEENQGKQNFKP